MNTEHRKLLEESDYFEIVLALLSYYNSVRLSRQQKLEIVKIHFEKYSLPFEDMDHSLIQILAAFNHLQQLLPCHNKFSKLQPKEEEKKVVTIALNILLLKKVLKVGIEGLYWYESLAQPALAIKRMHLNIYIKIEQLFILFYYGLTLDIFLYH